MDDKLKIKCWLKGVYVNEPGKDINVILGRDCDVMNNRDYETYVLTVNYKQMPAGKSEYFIGLKKIEDLTTDISVPDKNIYLPQRYQEVDLDISTLNSDSIDFFAIEGVFCINDDQVISFIDKNSPTLMCANFDQLQKAFELNNEDVQSYLSELRTLNFEPIFIDIDNEISGPDNIVMNQLEQLPYDFVKEIANENPKDLTKEKNKQEVR
jgi:hypothetical protein